MIVIKSIKTLRNTLAAYRRRKKTVGFVPTMGALHEGHLSLIRRSRRENDITVLSIFVNPTQFSPSEDFSAYPREGKKDKLLAKKERVDIIFYPSVEEIYPRSFLTFVEMGGLTKNLCGRSRPGHFKGVATVVLKLLNIVGPDKIYLGQKDAQQAAVIRQMIRDLNIPVTLRLCPIVREKNGLALSSRNKYLSDEQKKEASALYRSLKQARQRVLAGEHSATQIVRVIRDHILRHTSAKIEYIECVDADTLKPLKTLDDKIMIALAARFGQARLIDNIVVRVR